MKHSVPCLAVFALCAMFASCGHNSHQLTPAEMNMLNAAVPAARATVAPGRPLSFSQSYAQNLQQVASGAMPIDTIFAYPLGNGFVVNETLLSGAVAMNNPTLVNTLLEAGADPNVYTVESPLDMAERTKNTAIATRLESTGAHKSSKASHAVPATYVGAPTVVKVKRH